jgi:hypothetical protein
MTDPTMGNAQAVPSIVDRMDAGTCSAKISAMVRGGRAAFDGLGGAMRCGAGGRTG